MSELERRTHDSAPTPTSTANKVCQCECHGYDAKSCSNCFDAHSRIAGTSTPDFPALGTPTEIVERLRDEPTPDVQPVSPNGDDLDSAIIQLYLDGVNEKNIKALIAQRVLQGRIEELMRVKYMPSIEGSVAYHQDGIGNFIPVASRIVELTKDLK